MKIYLASDHAGFYLKERVKGYFDSKGFVVEDFGANHFNESDDYPDFIYPCLKQYIRETNGDFSKGFCIIFGGSGTGEAIVANRVRGARAVVFNHSENENNKNISNNISNGLEIVKLGRLHNNCNVLSVGARFVNEEQILEAIKIFQTTQFEGGRHAKRVFKIDFLNN